MGPIERARRALAKLFTGELLGVRVRKALKSLQPLTSAVGFDAVIAKMKRSERYRIAYDPQLIPPLGLMRQEGIDVLEEWFRWSEEWSMLLRVYGHIRRNSRVLEIGCGLGRVAFPLRYLLSSEGSYDGFEICRRKVDFLQSTFQHAYPNFRFRWADIRNTFYNPSGKVSARDYAFPYSGATFDLVFAASVFTHLLPDVAFHYLHEVARVLKPGGRCLISCFLLDNYRRGQARPLGFARRSFDFDHSYGDYDDEFAIVVPENPEEMTAYRLNLLSRYAQAAGLCFVQEPIPGLWSGSTPTWVGAQDLLVLEKE
jgi:SAM-dependent methyltransferase